MFFYPTIHFVSGVLAHEYPILIPVFTTYQLGQLYLSQRFFIHDLTWRKGNSMLHTALKMGQFGLGYLIG